LNTHRRPTVATLRRIGKSKGDDFRFLFAVETFSTRRFIPFFSVEGDVETFGDQSLSQIFDALSRAEKRIGDVLVLPIRPVGIRLEQNVGTPHFRIRTFQVFGDGKTRFPLFTGQTNNVNFLQGKTSLLVKSAIIAGCANLIYTNF